MLRLKNILLEVRHEGPRLLQAAPAVTDEHIAFIYRNGSGHIRQESMDYYRTHRNTPDNVLVECRAATRLLLGLSFAAILEGHTEYSINVVWVPARGQGIGESMLLLKKLLCEEKGVPLQELVAAGNSASMNLARKVFRHGDLVIANGQQKYIWHD